MRATKVRCLHPPRLIANCGKCGETFVFEPGATKITCKCGAENELPRIGCKFQKKPQCVRAMMGYEP